MIWRGIAIGIIISAPMGPVGILCVQRTLEKGRKTGFYTGIGAALSDLFYCLLTGFGLSFIEEFLTRNSNIIQLVGSVVLIGFGVYLFRSNPSKKLKKPVENDRIPAGKNILNGFLFTFSNPLIIFLIIGLFARFNFFIPEIKFYHYIIGFMSVIAGALIWWWIVTFFVDKVRAHFNLRSMWLINKIIGGVIFIFAIVGIITGITGIANASVFKSIDDLRLGEGRENLNQVTIPFETKEWSDLRFRLTNCNNEVGKKYSFKDSNGKIQKVSYPGWRIKINTGNNTWVIRVKTKDEKINSEISSPELVFTLYKDDEMVADRRYATGFNVFNGTNAFSLSVMNQRMKLEGGNRQYQKILAFDVESDTIESIRMEVENGGDVEISDIIIEYPDVISRKKDALYISENDIENIVHRGRGKDDLSGVWSQWGYSVDDSYIKPGGEYRIGIIPENAEGSDRISSKRGAYRIIYLGGARVGKDYWKIGMVRGRISPTDFEGIYNVEWLDAKGKRIKRDIKATVDASEMKIQIPDYSSSITFRKIDK